MALSILHYLLSTLTFVVFGLAVVPRQVFALSCDDDGYGLGTEDCPYWADVLVVGGGAAGLTAGATLKNRDTSVKILEANANYGGRTISSEDAFGFPIDLGAQWIHVYAKIAHDAGGGGYTHPNALLSAIVDSNGDPIPIDVSDKVVPDGRDYRWIDYSWGQFFREHVVEANKLQDDIDTGCVVNYIEYTSEWVWVECENGAVYEGYHAIVTVSMKILQDTETDDEMIEFDPPLSDSSPDHLGAIQSYKMGPGLKVWMEFSEMFYDDYWAPPGYSDDCSDEAVVREDWGQRAFYDEMKGGITHPGSTRNVLAMWSHGTGTAGKYQTDAPAEILAKILGELDGKYDGRASETYVDGSAVIQHWTQEPYVQTGYTQHAPGGTIEQLQVPLRGVLYFAGEAVPPDGYNFGFAHGAAQSGRYAALRILDRANPASPTRASTTQDSGGWAIGTAISITVALLSTCLALHVLIV